MGKGNHCLKLSISIEAPLAQMVRSVKHTQEWRVRDSEKGPRGRSILDVELSKKKSRIGE